jgi:chromosome segregation ATPase
MAAGTGKSRCSICGKEKRAVRCEGCLQLFCYDHLTDHRQELTKQLDLIEVNRDLFRQALNEQRNHPQLHSSFKQIDQWEEDSIDIIQQTANDCRQILIQQTTKNIHQIEIHLSKLSDHLRKIRQENDFNEIDLNQLEEKLKQLAEKLDKLSNFSIQQDSKPLIQNISVVVSPSKLVSYIALTNCTRCKKKNY